MAVGVLLLVIGTLSLLPETFWVFDLLRHFAPQSFAVGVLVTAAALVLRSPTSGLPATAATILNAGVLASIGPHAPTISDAAAEARPRLTVASFNLLWSNSNVDAVMAWIADSDADVIFILETGPEWRRALQDIRPPYRVALASPINDFFGTSVLSRVPVLHVEALEGAVGLRSAEVRVRVDGAEWTLLGLHPPPPVSAEWTEERDKQLARVEIWAQSQRGPTVVIGDFNATPFSEAFTRMPSLFRASDLDWSWPYTGVGLQTILRVSIDHALVGPGISVVECVRGPPLGSDHRPLTVRLTTTSSRAQAKRAARIGAAPG